MEGLDYLILKLDSQWALGLNFKRLLGESWPRATLKYQEVRNNEASPGF